MGLEICGSTAFGVRLRYSELQELPNVLGADLRTFHLGYQLPLSTQELQIFLSGCRGIRSFSYERTLVGNNLQTVTLPRIIAGWGPYLEHLPLGEASMKVVKVIAKHCMNLHLLKFSCTKRLISLNAMWRRLGAQLEHL